MKITSQITDQGILSELGQRLVKVRLNHNLTQAQLAEQAGISKRTVERLEAGEAATQLSSLIRLYRVLNLSDRLEMLAPEEASSPMTQLKMRGKERQRASRKKAASAVKKWTWGNEAA